jgi:hypothetical protein
VPQRVANQVRFAAITSQLRSAQDVAGDGFGFTWPASFPVVRIDQILVRGVEPDSSWVLPANGSDHRPVEASISWDMGATSSSGQASASSSITGANWSANWALTET